MTFLCDMWRFSAEEYMQFLGRNGIKCLGVYIVFRNRIVIFVDEEKYLDLSLNDKNFIETEKQIIKLLERSEKMVDKFMELAARAEHKEENFEETLQQYEDEE